MQLFDGILETLEKPFQGAKALEDSGAFWPSSNPNELLFHSDVAYELGGGNLPGVGLCLLTSNRSAVFSDGVYLLGEDIPSLKKDTPFGRVAIVEVDDKELGEGNTLYQAIRRIDYAKYHVAPKGLMLRISPLSQKEAARVGKKAIGDGMDFAKLGSLYIQEYKKQKGVKNVKIVFVTDPSFDYSLLQNAAKKSEDITKALDHLLNKVSMDCHSCSLQKVCNEVESMVKKDFPEQN